MRSSSIQTKLIGIALLALASPAAAESGSASRWYFLNWILGPHEIPDGTAWIREQGQILETHLLPTELYVAEGHVTGADGTVLMAAGQQVLRIQAQQWIACSVLRGERGTRSANNRVCLVDENGDGSLDSYFLRGTGGRYWYDLAGEVPRRLRPLSPATLRAVPREMFVERPLLSLHYQRILDGARLPIDGDNGSNMVRFHFKVGTAGAQRLWLTQACIAPAAPSYCTSAAFPSQFRFAGLVLDLLERRGEDINVRVSAPFEPRVVRVQNSGSIYGSQLVVVDGQ